MRADDVRCGAVDCDRGFLEALRQGVLLPYLLAVHSVLQVVDFIDCFGTMYAPVKHDVGGNVSKVRSAHQTAPEECATLDALLARDWAVHQPIDGALPYSAEGFLWLTR